TSAASSTQYSYTVVAGNALGNSPPSGVAAGTTYALATLTSLTATGVSTSEIDLSWVNNDSNATGVTVYRSAGVQGEGITSGSNFAPVATLGPTATSYQDTGLAALTNYFYYVVATGAAGTSANSTSATGHTFETNPPTGLTATAVSASQINIAWTYSGTASQFIIQRWRTGSTWPTHAT